MRANVLARGPRVVSLAAMAKRVMSTMVARQVPVDVVDATAVPVAVWPMASRATARRSNDGAMSVRPSGESRRIWTAVARGMRR